MRSSPGVNPDSATPGYRPWRAEWRFTEAEIYVSHHTAA